MAAQLAQFSSLEKLTDIDTGISKLAAVSDPKNSLDALNLIGKAVDGDSTKILRNSSDEDHDIKFKLLADATNVTLNIKDANNEVIRTLEVTGLKQGDNKITWNGLNDDGAAVAEGEYNVVIEAKNAAGAKIVAESKFSGVITGVNFTNEGPVLMIGNQKVRMQDIKKIIDPRGLGKANIAKINNSIDKKTEEVAKASKNMLEKNVGMSRGLMNKLDKETR